MGNKNGLTKEQIRYQKMLERINPKPKSKGRKCLDFLVDNVVFIIASCLYSMAVQFFAVPNHIAQSGSTGLSIVLNHLIPNISIGAANMIINIPLLIIAGFVIGWKFVGKTMWVTVILSTCLDIMGKIAVPYTGDPMLATLFCGVLAGAGLSLVIMRGATTGGTDVIGRLFRHKWPHMSMGKVIMAADMCVIAISAIVFKSMEAAMYALVVIFVSSNVIDYILYGTGSGKLLLVVTKKAPEVAALIRGKLVRGVTIIPVTGGYKSDEEKHMLVCAVRKNEVAKLTKLIWTVDQNPFIIVTEAGEILGEGFKGKEENN